MTKFEEMMIYKGKVLDRYPDAYHKAYSNTYMQPRHIIYDYYLRILGVGYDENKAWQNAYDNLKKEDK